MAAPTILLSTKNPTILSWLKDMAERSLSTFVQAFIAFLIVDHSLTSSTLYAALIAGGLAVLKSISVQLASASPQTTSTTTPTDSQK